MKDIIDIGLTIGIFLPCLAGILSHINNDRLDAIFFVLVAIFWTLIFDINRKIMK